jgi:hypothetical protein
MVFSLFPDPAGAPLTVAGNGRVDVAFTQRAGAPPANQAGIYAQMMYMRVAMIAGTEAPELFLQAGDGPSVAVTADTTPVHRGTGAGGVGTGFVGDVTLAAQDGNVFQITLGFEAVTTEAWRLGIHNTDPTAARLYTWAVADTADDTAQPWVEPATFAPAFAEDPSQQIVPDAGWDGTPVTLTGRNFHIGTARVSFGAVAAELLAPPTPTSLKVAVPRGLVPDSKTPVTVVTDAGTATSAREFHLLGRHVVILGHRDHGIDALAQLLIAAGNPTVTTGPESFRDDTELVVTAVSCRDGPMPATRESVLALDGRVLPRVAVVITDVDEVADAEIQDLVRIETLEVLANVGIEPVGADQVIKTPGQDVAAEIGRILITPKRNYRVAAP